MPFINSAAPKEKSSGDSAYFEVTEDQKNLRPGAPLPESTWVHKYASVKVVAPNGKEVQVRGFRSEACTSTNKSGVGCRGCTTKDPLWDLLTDQNKFNRSGMRVDFGKTVLHVVPVVDLVDGVMRILKGGNQTFEKMATWLNNQKSDELKDLRRCEWSIWKTGKGMTTKYFSDRQDASPFNFTPELVEAAKVMMKKALDDLKPRTDDDFMTYIHGEDQELIESARAAFKAGVVPTMTHDETSKPSLMQAAVTPQSTPEPTGNNEIGLKTFVEWMNKQSEFQGGGGMITVLVPLLKEHLNGEINYHKLSTPQLEKLQAFLTTKLAAMRK